MLWVAVFVCLVTGGLLVAPRSPLRVISSVQIVRPGKFKQILERDATALEVHAETEEDVAAEEVGRARFSGSAGGDHGSETTKVVPVAVGVTAAQGTLDWLHPDPRVLGALEQFTGDRVDNVMDLWRTVGERDYQLFSKNSLVKWRGAVGEQDVYAQLHSVLGDRVQHWKDSNHAGSDLAIDGNEFNVKITEDYRNVASSHFSAHPDIPIIINSDASNIPPQALRVDTSEPFDPADLAEHSVIVAEGLTLSGNEAALADVFGSLVGGWDAERLLEGASDLAVPGITVAITIVRAGIKEADLYKLHGDRQRLLENLAAQAALAGGGATVGGAIGGIAGGAVDVATAGATVGLGSVVGKAAGAGMGALVGNKGAARYRERHLRRAETEARRSLTKYMSTVDRTQQKVAQAWSASLDDVQQDMAATRTQLRSNAGTLVKWAQTQNSCEDLLSDHAVRDRLDRASRKVDRALARERSILARRRVEAWRREARRATSIEQAMDVIASAPGGKDEVRELVAAVTERRQRTYAITTAGLEAVSRSAIDARRDAVEHLTQQRELLAHEARLLVDQAAEKLNSANGRVKTELAMAGRPTPG